MPRAQKTPDSDGMSWVQVMPFPALNPWNWWALTAPNNAWMAMAKGAEAALASWRSNADLLRTMVRQQQDAALSLCAAQFAPHAGTDAESGQPDAAAPQDAPDFVTPMLEATRAYSRAGKAFIIAQRNTMRAFAPPDRPH